MNPLPDREEPMTDPATIPPLPPGYANRHPVPVTEEERISRATTDAIVQWLRWARAENVARLEAEAREKEGGASDD